ncbi:hypothetical protein LEL_10195 [Akanthomyces lecanii RCEF 1005]|uniref:Uncharacterized protein n=1 Tax=Akanthomyces lecanii RCEF 1005 TaxID=1081108 RepID=A0A162MRZ8_CORDF|nr:hypothetical protein LEL_10195 [Akanthomyces lecanii RCEF 1005]
MAVAGSAFAIVMWCDDNLQGKTADAEHLRSEDRHWFCLSCFERLERLGTAKTCPYNYCLNRGTQTPDSITYWLWNQDTHVYDVVDSWKPYSH